MMASRGSPPLKPHRPWRKPLRTALRGVGAHTATTASGQSARSDLGRAATFTSLAAASGPENGPDPEVPSRRMRSGGGAIAVPHSGPPRIGCGSRVRHEDGAALLIALLSMTLMAALGLALVLTTMTETMVSANYRDGVELFYAADAAAEWALGDLARAKDWNPILMGLTTSAFTDGPPVGPRSLGPGSTIDLGVVTNLVRCGKRNACSEADMNAATDERPWGVNNPRWQAYAYGPLTRMLAGTVIDSRAYVVVWVADDQSENDGNPQVDGGTPVVGPSIETNPGAGVLIVRVHAYGPGGARRVVEFTMARLEGEPFVRTVSWREGQ
jgi:hypothetical protein